MAKLKKNRKPGFFAMLLALLGIGGCNSLEATDDICGPMMLMYGTPTAHYSVKGKVTNENGQPIEGLQVILGRRYYDSSEVQYDTHYRAIDTLSTGADGVYQFDSGRTFPVENLQIDVNDIDGPAGGGEFHSATTVIRDIQYTGRSGWFVGEAEIDVPDIKLKKK